MQEKCSMSVALLIDLLLNSLSYPYCLEYRIHTQNSSVMNCNGVKRKETSTSKSEDRTKSVCDIEIPTVGTSTHLYIRGKSGGEPTSVPARRRSYFKSANRYCCFHRGFTAGLSVHSRDTQSVSTANNMKNYDKTTYCTL